jgi:integrase
MSSIQATKNVGRDPIPPLESWRDAIPFLIGDYGELAAIPWDRLRTVEIFPGCRLDAEVLEMPKEWMPAGELSKPSKRRVVPTEAGVPDDPALAGIRDESIRRALLALFLPRIMGNGIRESAPATWRSRAGLLLRMAAWQLQHFPSPDGTVFSQFTVVNVLTKLFPAMEASTRTAADCRVVLNTLIDAGERKVISDWPKLFRHGKDGESTTALERSRRGEEVRRREVTAPSRNYQHLSDEFVTEFMRRALWIHENLADQAIDFWHADTELRDTMLRDGWTIHNPVVVAARLKAMQAFPWKNAANEPLTKLPFPLRETDTKGNETLTKEWPPKSVRAFKRLIGTVQGCNLGTVDLCTGARGSELLAADDTPLGHAEGRYHSITFKLVDEVSGQPRDWPLHPVAVRALKIQHRIAETVRPEGERQLWVALRADLGSRLTSATATFDRTVEHLAIEHLLGQSSAHMHRWRHTVARLVALSVVGAPQVLLDLFGHRDLEMTMHYMLSDPSIAEEAMRVARETNFAMVENAIVETADGKTGGPAAAQLRKNLPTGMRHAEKAYDVKSLRELAEVLTFDGRYWSVVREGVICTKGLGQYGPCTAGRGSPDPGACRTGCDHRLELAMAKHQCEEALASLIRERRSASTDGLEMLVERFDGQIVSELKRWDEVRERVLAENPDVRAIWEASST